MDDMEQKLNSILGNPEMMAQIMSMAQSFGLGKSEAPPQADPPPKQDHPISKAPSLPAGVDMAMLKKMYGFAQNANIDRNQQALLKALSPYLSHARVLKLEKAMRAAKIAGVATAALGTQGFPFFTGR